MNAQEMREYAVELMKRRRKKNTYTNGGDRKYFFGKPDNDVSNTAQKGFSDCSSAVRAAIRAAAGIDIGGNTDAQIRNRAKGLIVHQTEDGMPPDESLLKAGDALYFRGNKYHIMDVGHVEMYTGKNELYGHGSGIGPVAHDLKEYCARRRAQGKGYFMTIRWITDDMHSDTELPRPTLRYGSSGDVVKELQGMLIELGYSCGRWGADGEFGRSTESAVKVFQAERDLVADGIVGKLTWAALEALQAGDTDDDTEQECRMAVIGMGSWHVRTAPSKDAPKLGYVKNGDILPLSGDSAAGWVGVMYNGERAWVSAKGVGSVG